MKRMLNYWQFINENDNNGDLVKGTLNKLDNDLKAAFTHFEVRDGEIKKEGDGEIQNAIPGLKIEESKILKNALTFILSDAEYQFRFLITIDEKNTEKCTVDLTILSNQDFSEVTPSEVKGAEEKKTEEINGEFLVGMISDLKPKSGSEDLGIEYEK